LIKKGDIQRMRRKKRKGGIPRKKEKIIETEIPNMRRKGRNKL